MYDARRSASGEYTPCDGIPRRFTPLRSSVASRTNYENMIAAAVKKCSSALADTASNAAFTWMPIFCPCFESKLAQRLRIRGIGSSFCRFGPSSAFTRASLLQ